jgi:hypothetical protein
MTPTDAQALIDELLQASWDYELSSPDETGIHEVYLELKQRVIAAITAAVEAEAIADEREACARVAEKHNKSIAAAIRARKDT